MDLYGLTDSTEFGYTSLEPATLAIQTYLHILNLPYYFHTSSPTISPSGTLPVLKIRSQVIAGTSNIISILKGRGHDLDSDLSKKEKALSTAYIALAESTLNDVFLYSWYGTLKNFEFQQPELQANLAFFSRMPQRTRERHLISLAKYREGEILKMARSSYIALDSMLGDQTYFFGGKVSTLDCFVYSQLALHFCSRLPVTSIYDLLATFPRLVAFIATMEGFKKPLIKAVDSRSSLKSTFKGLWTDPSIFLDSFVKLFSFALEEDEEENRRNRVERFYSGLSVVGIVLVAGTFFARAGVKSFTPSLD